MQLQPLGLPPVPPPALRTAAPPGAAHLVDGFAGPAWTPEARPWFPESRPPGEGVRSANLGQRVALATVAGLVGVLALPSAALAYAPPPAATTGVAGNELAEAARYGLSPQTAQRLLASPDTVQTLRSLPGDVATGYKSLSPRQKSVIFQELTGTTRVGLLKVNNRKAFVAGSVMGVDALPRMLENIDKRVEEGEITPREGDQLKAMMQRQSRLTPTQRSAIADVVEMEGPGR